VAEGRLENHLKVKRGMPFAPSLAAGLLSAPALR
jgi:prepilin signal peptidase PulO-like enzyme (type II secretory pathway)